MIDRLLNSWLYRSSSLFRLFARCCPIPVETTSHSPLRYLTMGGSGHLEMMDASLRSLAATWPERPALRVVVADETNIARVEHQLRWWKGAREVISWRSAADWAAREIDPALLRFAQREPMGRKLAAVLQAASEGPVLYGDVDVLWFRHPASIDDLLPATEPLLAMSTDLYPSYDDRLVPEVLPELAGRPFFCAGIMFATGRIWDNQRFRDLLEFAAREGVGVTEQTIFAMLDRDLGNRRLPENEIYLSDVDRLARSATFLGQPWAARHYVGQVRHLFWKDAVRLGWELRGRMRQNDRHA